MLLHELASGFRRKISGGLLDLNEMDPWLIFQGSGVQSKKRKMIVE
jgi:hypothetical protein